MAEGSNSSYGSKIVAIITTGLIVVGLIAALGWYVLPFMYNERIPFESEAETSSVQTATEASTSPVVVVQVPQPPQATVSARQEVRTAFAGNSGNAAVEMQLGEHLGSGEVRASDVGIDVAGTIVDTGTGYRHYGQPVRRPNGTVCRSLPSGERQCVPGVCTADPQSGRQVCRPT